MINNQIITIIYFKTRLLSRYAIFNVGYLRILSLTSKIGIHLEASWGRSINWTWKCLKFQSINRKTYNVRDRLSYQQHLSGYIFLNKQTCLTMTTFPMVTRIRDRQQVTFGFSTFSDFSSTAEVTNKTSFQNHSQILRKLQYKEWICYRVCIQIIH
jgi:hypothetical protein